MAKIDMNKIKETTVNSTKIEESQNEKQAETVGETKESIDNAIEATEDTNEIKQEPKAETEPTPEFGNKVVVRYVGNGIWKDIEGKLWASENKSDGILNERQYTTEEYDNRDDIKFMVGYGAMQETYVK